jgi:hypothetical protein
MLFYWFLASIIYCIPFILIVVIPFGFKHLLSLPFMCGFKYYPYIWTYLCIRFAAILTMLSNLGSDFQSEIYQPPTYV